MVGHQPPNNFSKPCTLCDNFFEKIAGQSFLVQTVHFFSFHFLCFVRYLVRYAQCSVASGMNSDGVPTLTSSGPVFMFVFLFLFHVFPSYGKGQDLGMAKRCFCLGQDGPIETAKMQLCQTYMSRMLVRRGQCL